MSSYTYSFDQISSTLHEKTPLIESPKISAACNHRVLLKLDNLQPAGSFKIRGIGNLVQRGIENGKRSAISSSGGNAGLAAAYACARSNIPCHVFVPNSTPQFAADNIKEHAAQVTYHGENWNAADNEARRHLTEESIYIHPFDGEDIWNGHATIIDELKGKLIIP
ncbi:Oidioi.mRNA.OKI2018_I69.XSR.g14728.t1.cds [Oikopleura dioica]|uniref:L-serine ammonia-lyase n=1 Tax=Oikopleura dioica TaxID=34765 RepID=A0ABN7SEP6_OIKDI|nr:Oidioi.mRNA.OKI2018_I69.XSR.g14728.t1.cds [Oikopleura dioica]